MLQSEAIRFVRPECKKTVVPMHGKSLRMNADLCVLNLWVLLLAARAYI